MLVFEVEISEALNFKFDRSGVKSLVLDYTVSVCTKTHGYKIDGGINVYWVSTI